MQKHKHELYPHFVDKDFTPALPSNQQPATYNISLLLKYIICTLCYVLCNVHNSENSYFVRIFKYKVSQKGELNIIYTMFFIICLSLYISQYALHSMHFTVCTSHYALHRIYFKLCTSYYALHTMHFTLYISQYAFHIINLTVCISQYAFQYELQTMAFTLCTSHYVFHIINFTVCISQYAFDSMPFRVCISE